MGSSRMEIELEEQLKEAGNMLLSPPSSVEEVINLLDKVEHLLANVEQAPSKSMQDALLLPMKALIADELLRHPDANVRLSVASCISEITRITAPEAPYNDELMKEVFQLTVVAFEKLSLVSGRCYTKAVSILDTVAKVRSCLLMLDLECDTLIIEMFQHFLKVIRSNHPHVVFSSMETIMTLVVDESEDVSSDLLSILLASVRKDNQDVSPISYKLGEKVITNCAAKLKSSLIEAVKSRDVTLDEYAEIVAYICESGYENLRHGCLTGTGDLLATNEPESVCLEEVTHDVNGLSKSMMSNGNAPSRNEESAMKDKSSKVLEQCTHGEHFESVDTKCNARPGSLDNLRTMKSEIEPENAPKKRGRKPNSLMNPEEGYDHSWICTGRKTSRVPVRRKSHDKGTDSSPSASQDSKKEALHSTRKKVNDPTTGSPKSSPPDINNQTRGWPKKAGSMMNQDAEENATHTADFSLEKEPEDRYDTEIKRRKRSKTNKESTHLLGDGVSEKEAEVPGDLKGKPQQLSLTKARRRSINDDGASVQEDIKERSLVVAISAKGRTEASGAKKKKSSKDAVKSSNRDGNGSEDTPKAELKKKLSTMKEEKKMNSKAAVKSSNRDANSVDTPKTEVKKKLTDRKEEKKTVSKAAVKSSKREGNCSEDTPKAEVKKKHVPGKEEKTFSKTAIKSSNRHGSCSEETPKTAVKKKHAPGKQEKMIAVKSSNRDRNCSEDSTKTDVKKKHTTKKEERKMIFGVAAKSSDRDGNHSEESPKTGVKRKRTAVKEVASGTPWLGEQLVGSRIKVWWPLDKMFYEGVVDSYDHIKKKHRVLYADGDEEKLNLKRQRWELVEGRLLSEGGQEKDAVKTNASSDIFCFASSDEHRLLKEKEETEFELVKEVKASSLKRNTSSASGSKPKVKKSGRNFSDSSTLGKPSEANESNVDVSKKDSSPKGDDQNSAAKLILRDRKLIFTLSKPQQSVTSSNVDSLKCSSSESPEVGRSAGEQDDKPEETSREAKKENTSSDDETNVDGKKGSTANDVGKIVDGEKGSAASDVGTNVDGEKGSAAIDVETNVDGEKGSAANDVEKGSAAIDVETNVDGEGGSAVNDVETNVDGEGGSAVNDVETNVDGEGGSATNNVEANVDVDGRKP
ncbi:Sister chromatid cohesion protein PDS5 B-B like [Melia azedarach]|uniref:Sister chromatid cohesion protein PDS5 B-B like n=1 Tax=Melia azedarach TaxID=155640 RepID=A0ACC1Y548_MELAZ|nr:Sister chromatid cohesion protein PDS5 B-B like [Melia azedarach]